MVTLALVGMLTAFTDTPLPRNIVVAPSLVNTMAEALRASPTLRELIHHLSRAERVHIHIDLDPLDTTSDGVAHRAYTRFRRYQFGLIIAVVRLPSTRGAAALLAHELAHVREYADGMDYLAASIRTPFAVWKTGSYTFETARAMDIERVVAAEVRLTQARQLDR